MPGRRRITAVAAILMLALGGCALVPGPRSEAGSVTSVQPAVGSVSGGTTVTMRGSGLGGVDGVTVNDVPAIITATAEDTLVITTPAAVEFADAEVVVRAWIGDSAVGDAIAFRYTLETGVDRQLNYAMTYWQDYNTAEWGDLNSIGGDCANFVSQSLIARGWDMTPDWFSRDAGQTRSEAWGYAPSFDAMLRGDTERGLSRIELTDRGAVKLGDIVVLDWNGNGVPDHVAVVSRVAARADGTIAIKLVAHNGDSRYRDLDKVLTEDHPGATGYVWSVPPE